MTNERLTRAISETLHDLATGSDTDYIDDVLAQTARMRQRPAWTFPLRYTLMTPFLKFATAAGLILGIGLGLAVVAGDRSDRSPGHGTCPLPAASRDPSSSLAPDDTPAPVVIGDCEPWIAYQWFQTESVGQDLTVKAVRPEGTDAHVVVAPDGSAAMHVDWSHDGQRLVFDHWTGSLIDIWTANADGSEARPLVACEQPCQQLASPAWSPDDTELVVARSDDTDGGVTEERCYLEIIDAGTLDRRVILEGSAGTASSWECFATPRWSPDGSSIVFTLDGWGPGGSGWTLAGRAVAIIDAAGPPDQEPRILTDPALLATHPDWSPTEDLIVFGTRDVADFQDDWLATNLYTMRSDGTDLQQVTDYGDGDAKATYPTWTPDGTEIAFSYIEPTTGEPGDHGQRELALIRPDGGGLYVVPGVRGMEPRLRPIP
jgi:WD40-like Beta Propeller Repeat